MISAPGPLGRRLVAGLAAAPALTCSIVPTLAQTPAAAQTQAVLKAASGTKLVTLGTGNCPGAC
jgi:hypothetical protein